MLPVEDTVQSTNMHWNAWQGQSRQTRDAGTTPKGGGLLPAAAAGAIETDEDSIQGTGEHAELAGEAIRALGVTGASGTCTIRSLADFISTLADVRGASDTVSICLAEKRSDTGTRAAATASGEAIMEAARAALAGIRPLLAATREGGETSSDVGFRLSASDIGTLARVACLAAADRVSQRLPCPLAALLMPRAPRGAEPEAPPTRTPPSLDLWHRALEGARALSVEESSVMPMGFGGTTDVSGAAFVGDKALGVAVAWVLEANGIQGSAELTLRQSRLVSNANLAKRLEILLPEHMGALLPSPDIRERQIHDCGTMIEACVKFVCDAGNAEALMQLAEFLFAAEEHDAESLTGAEARDGGGALRVLESNPKGRLLERDPKADFNFTGGPDHGLPWRATVMTNGAEYEGEGSSKGAAAAEAATKALEAVGIFYQREPARTLALNAGEHAARSAAERLARTTTHAGEDLTWGLMTFPPHHQRAILKDGQTPMQWLLEKPKEIHRIFCSPGIFGHVVSNVRIWRAHLEEGYITMILVQAAGADGEASAFVTPHPEGSKTSANKLACVLAHAHILELVHRADTAAAASAGGQMEE